MAQFPQFFSNVHQLNTRSGDSRDMVVISGHAGFHWRGTGGSWLRDEFLIPVGPTWSALHDCAPMVTISAISNSNHAVNAGWAIDWCTWGTQNRRLLIRAGAAVRDSDGYLLRVAFTATCIGHLG